MSDFASQFTSLPQKEISRQDPFQGDFWNNLQQESAAQEATRAANVDRYKISLSDEEYSILNQSIANAQMPETEAYRWASAIQYSRNFGMPLQDAYADLDKLNAYWLGPDKNDPKSNFKAVTDSFQLGRNTVELAGLGSELAQYEADNDTWNIDRVQKRIAELNADNNTLIDSQPRPWAIEALKFGAQSLPFTGAVIGAGLVGSLLSPVAGTGAAFAESMKQSQGLEYLHLRDAGVDKKYAKWISLVSGGLQAGVEVALGNVAGTLGAATGANTITSNVLKRLSARGVFGKIGKTLMHYGMEATEEGAEEAIQELISYGATALSAELQGAGVEVPTADEEARSVWENFKGGFMGSLVLGIPGTAISAKTEFKSAQAVKNAAMDIDSREAFVQATSDSPVFEGMTDADRAETQTKIWDNFSKERDARIQERTAELADTQDFSGEGDSEAQVSMDEEAAPVTRGAVQRTESGALYTQEGSDIVHNSDGSTTRILKAGNPNEETSHNRYGYIKYREYDDHVVVDDFRLSRGREDIRREFFDDFSQKVAGKRIEWEPASAAGRTFRDQVIAENPAGTAAGLQYYTGDGDIESVKGKTRLDTQIKKYLPKLDANERGAAVALLEARAAAKGVNLSDYVEKTFQPEIFSEGKPAIDAAQSAGIGGDRIKGGVSFDKDLSGDAKALIYVTEKSDFSTYTHEVAHVFRRELEGDQLAEAERAFGVTNGKWTRDAEERFAVGFEDYLREGKAPTSTLQDLYRKMAEFLHRIYRALSPRVNVSPDIRRVYDELLAGTGPLSEIEWQTSEREKSVKKEISTAVDKKPAANNDTADEISPEASEAGQKGAVPRAPDTIHQNLSDASKEILDEAGAVFGSMSEEMFFQSAGVKKLLEQMSREELIEMLHSSDAAAGLPNYRAYRRDVERDGAWPVQVSLDADSLKWVNDNMGHSAGDLMLREIGEKIKIAADGKEIRAYHKSGDEFLVQAKSVNDYMKFKVDLDKSLENVILAVRDENIAGLIEKPGIFLSDGIDNQGDMNAADKNLEPEKSYREAHGERAGRGKVPPGVRIIYDDGRITDNQAAQQFFDDREEKLKQRLESEKANSKPVNQFTPERKRELRKIIEDGGDILFQYNGENANLLNEEQDNYPIDEGIIYNEFRNYREKWLKKGVAADIYPNTRTLSASVTIKVDKNKQLIGLGTQAMKEAVSLAERFGIRLELTPTDEWGSSKKRLINFYKRFGFVENEGKNKDYRIRETMYRNPNTSIFFQTEEELIRDAASFDTWQEFMEYYDSGSWSRPVDAATPENADAQWYQTVWEKAHELVPEESLNTAEVEDQMKADDLSPGTPSTKDALWITEMQAHPDKLNAFLKQINWIMTQKNEFAPKDEAEQLDMENVERLKRRITTELRHGSWISNATRVAAGRELTMKARRTLLTLMQGASRDYRSLYADIMEDPEWSVALADTEAGRLAKIADPKLDYSEMTPEQRRRIADKIENQEISRKLSSGELTIDEAERHIAYLKSELKQSEAREQIALKAIEDEKVETSADYRRISDWQTRRLLELKDELDLARAKHESRSDQTSRMIERGQAITKKYELESQQLKSTYDTIFRKFSDLSRAMEISGAVKTALARRESLFEARAESARLREQISAAREARRIRTGLVKQTMRKVSFDRVNYEEAEKIIAIQRKFFPALSKGLNKWIGTEGPYLREVYSKWKTSSDFRGELESMLSHKKGGRKLLNLFEKDFDSWTRSEREEALKVLPKEDVFDELDLDALAREREESLQMDENSDNFERIIKEALPARVLARIENRPFAEWTIEEMEELAGAVDKLFTDGRRHLEAKKIAKQEDAALIRSKIEHAIKDAGVLASDSPEEKERKTKALEAELLMGTSVKGTLADSANRRSLRNRILRNGYSDANIRRVARILDNGHEGINTDLLYNQEDRCFNEEHGRIRDRTRKITAAMNAAGVELHELYQKKEISNFWDTGKSQSFTVDELLFILKADDDEQSQRAVKYGNMVLDIEKDSFRGSDDLIESIANPRYQAALAAARALPEKFLKFADSISADYGDQYERMNKASIDEFNQPVWRVQNYVPLLRLDESGETNENKVRDDLLNLSGGRNQTGTDKGMTQKRIEISPMYQRPVQMGLYSTWNDSVKRTEHFIAYAPYVRELNRVYKSRDASNVRGWIRSKFGDKMTAYIDDYINECANPDAGSRQSDLDRIIRSLRGRTAPAYLAWKFSGVLKQFATSPAPYFAHVSPAEYAAAAFDLARNYQTLSDSIREKSVFMDTRVMDPMIDLIREQQDKAINPAAAEWMKVTNIGMKGLEFADWSCVAPGWLAVYRKQFAVLTKENESIEANETARLENENEARPIETMYTAGQIHAIAAGKVRSTDEIEQMAIKAADDATRLCQPSGRLADLAPMFKSREKNSEALKIITQFQSALNVIWQNVRYDLPQAVKDKQWGAVVGTVGGYVAAGIAVNLLTNGLGGDGNDDDYSLSGIRNLVYYATTQFTDAVPLIGDLVSSLTGKMITGKSVQLFSDDMFPAVSKVFQAATAATSGDWDKTITRISEGLGYVFGAPVSGIKELGRVFGIGDDDGNLEFNPEAFMGRR